MTDLLHPVGWIHELRPIYVVLALVAGMLGAALLGQVAGKRQAAASDVGRGHFSAVQASLLALLALLLSFTLSMANARHETRRLLVVEDANNLSALHLRSRHLSEPVRAEFVRLLRDYAAARPDAATIASSADRRDLADRVGRATELHSRMWAIACGEMQVASPPKGAEALASLLIDSQSIVRRRAHAFQSRVPDAIILLLLAAAVAGAGVVGYSGGLGKHRATLQALLLAFFVSATIFAILSLDHPTGGLLTVDQGAVRGVLEALERDVGAER